MCFKEVIFIRYSVATFQNGCIYLYLHVLHYAKINGMQLFSLGESPKVCTGEFFRYRFCAIIGMSELVFHAVLQFISKQNKLIISCNS